ncbi:MAG: zinc ribbon domain-containing protein [Clostridia bacterium]|nr:zinc ribbon domain-containing protein [Clostridia bacterium]
MYCQKCGKPLQDGVSFCIGCGAPVDLPDVKPAVVRSKKRASLTVPMIFAAIAMTLFLVSWIGSLSSVSYFFSHMREVPVFALFAIDNIVYVPIWIVGSLCIFLFCLTERKSGKTTLLGIGCLILAFVCAYSLLYRLVYIVIVLAADGVSPTEAFRMSFTVKGSLRQLLCSAGAVLFLIEAISAFKGKVNKIIGILAACVVLALALLTITF